MLSALNLEEPTVSVFSVYIQFAHLYQTKQRQISEHSIYHSYRCEKSHFSCSLVFVLWVYTPNSVLPKVIYLHSVYGV